jgi:hypothetical protein
MGTAPAFGRALAPCNGSDLLPLRLRSICSWVTRFSRRPNGGGFASFARLARSPLHRIPFASSLVGLGLLVGWTHRNTALRPGHTVATGTLWGNCINSRPETGRESDSARTRFLSSRLAAQLLCRITGSAATPSRGTGDICLTVTRVTEGRAAPVAARLSPVARDYPNRALGGFFMPPALRLFYQGTTKNCVILRDKSRLCSSQIIHEKHAVNNLCAKVAPVLFT